MGRVCQSEPGTEVRLRREAGEVRSDLADQHQGGVDADRRDGTQIHTHHRMQRLVEMALLCACPMGITERFCRFGCWRRGWTRQSGQRLSDRRIALADLGRES